MIDTRQFETSLEALENEIDDLPHSATKNNLIDISNTLYGIFESLDATEAENIKKENIIMRKLLAGILTDEQKRSVKFRYRIDIDEGTTGNEWVL